MKTRSTILLMFSGKITQKVKIQQIVSQFPSVVFNFNKSSNKYTKSLPFVMSGSSVVCSLFDVLLGECLFDSNAVVKKLHNPS